MSENWVNDIIDEAVKEVEKWPDWMKEGKVRVSEPIPKQHEKGTNRK